MWTRTPQPGLWFTGGAFSQARIYSRYIAAADRCDRGGAAGEASACVASVPHVHSSSPGFGPGDPRIAAASRSNH